MSLQVRFITSVFLIVLSLDVVSGLQYECDKDAVECETTLVVQHRLTMMHYSEKQVYPFKGKLYKYDVTDPTQATPVPTEEVMTADGWEVNRLVVVANSSIPAPTIIVYEGQMLKVHIINKMASDTLTIHWHGLPQHETPWMDGVPFVTQCPILAGQTFTYHFRAEPKGTYWYHSHVGAQRTKGMAGALVIREKTSVMPEHIMTIQGWNHRWGADLDHQKMLVGDYEDRTQKPSTDSVDGGHFSRFWLTSALLNGRGRYYHNMTSGEHNEAPLEVFTVHSNVTYRFRVVNVGTLYPFRVSIDNHNLTLIASDGFDFRPVEAESFIINPGERYDFTMTANQAPDNYWIRANTLEVGNTHIAEAILRYSNVTDQDPTTSRRMCTPTDRCLVVNCPFSTFPADTYTDCLRFDQLRSAVDDDPAPEPTSAETFKEHFLNFAFPGITYWPSAINGKQFLELPVSALTQPFEIETTCDKADCGEEKLCHCTNVLPINHNEVVQLVLTNMGVGTGWSHPVHLHGYSFYVLKMGYATYNMTTSKFISQNTDIDCRGKGDMAHSFCNNATWRNTSWLGNNVPGLELDNPPRKDTLIIPSGGYAVIRIKADNPGVWIMHCHIQLHANDGMVMLLNNSYSRHPAPPKGFPICHGYPSPYREQYEESLQPQTTPIPDVDTVTETGKINKPPYEDGPYGMKTFWIMVTVLGLVCLFLLAGLLHYRKQVKTFQKERKSRYARNITASNNGTDNPAFETITKY